MKKIGDGVKRKKEKPPGMNAEQQDEELFLFSFDKLLENGNKMK